jgi:membrane-bound lytic murein transglycosylase A
LNLAGPTRATPRAWQAVCAAATDPARAPAANNPEAVRKFLQTWLAPWRLDGADGKPASNIVTGYYEPIMNGSRVRTSRYTVPLYGYPVSWKRNKPNPGPSRAELMDSNLLRGSELVWVEDPVAAAFMQIQGSGKVRLDDGTVLRFGFAGTNDQPFKSFAQWLLNKGEITRSQATMQGIQSWARRNPRRVEEMLNANPRFVFFKELPSNVSPDLGPIGALGVPLTAERSIAVDLKAMPLGAPVFVATTRPLSKQSLRRLVMAQDTGTAIVGGVRADYYWGTGDAAGELAGRMKQDGQMWLLLPK